MTTQSKFLLHQNKKIFYDSYMIPPQNKLFISL